MKHINIKAFRSIAMVITISLILLAFSTCDLFDMLFSDDDPKTIDILDIAGISVPVRNEAPSPAHGGNITPVGNPRQFTGTVEWHPNHNPFQVGTAYTARISLTAESGFTFYGIDSDSFRVAGANSVTHDAGTGDDSLVVEATFAATQDVDPVPITIRTINLTIPLVGALPATSISSDQFTGTVAWLRSVPVATHPNTEQFEADTRYMAIITLTPNAGYNLVGIPQNWFRIPKGGEGENEFIPTVHASESDFIHAGFLTPAYPTVNITEIEGITPPVTGETPVTEITLPDEDEIQFTGKVEWLPDHLTFHANTLYMANITLTAGENFTFHGMPANSFTISGATVTHLSGWDSEDEYGQELTITAIFPRTGAEDTP